MSHEGTTNEARMVDGHVLEGTAKQIAEAMHALAFGRENRTLSEYIDWAVDQARRMNEIDRCDARRLRCSARS